MPGDALVIGLAKKVKPKGAADDAEEASEGEDTGSIDDVEQSAAADLADALGADSDKVSAIKSALGDFVEACVKRLKGGDY